MKSVRFEEGEPTVIGVAPSASAKTWMRLDKAEIDERIALEVKLIQFGCPLTEKRGLENKYLKNALDLRKFNQKHVRVVCKKYKTLTMRENIIGLGAEKPLLKYIQKVSQKQDIKAQERAEMDEREARRLHRQDKVFPRQLQRMGTAPTETREPQTLRRLGTAPAKTRAASRSPIQRATTQPNPVGARGRHVSC